MTDQFSPEQSTPNFESDLQKLAFEVKNYQEKPETKELSAPEMIKKALEEATPNLVQNPTASGSDGSLLPGYAQSASPSVKVEVESLIQKAMQGGIFAAAEEARRSSPYVLDAFHDAITGKLHEELEKRGMLK